MQWVKVTDERKPENGKTYWVTVKLVKGFLMDAMYKDGKWYFDNSELINVVAWYDVPRPEPFEIEAPTPYHFPDCDINTENGNNKKLSVNILDEASMRKAGFTDYAKDTWYYSRMLKQDISFCVSIKKKNPKDFRIDVLDENFLQPYDYQAMLERDANNKFAYEIMQKVEKEMKKLKEAGIVLGHEEGEYI